MILFTIVKVIVQQAQPILFYNTELEMEIGMFHRLYIHKRSQLNNWGKNPLSDTDKTPPFWLH
jgi:hypothetical protein